MGGDVSRLLAEACGGVHHFAGDGVDLPGREMFLHLFLTAPGEKSYSKEQDQRNRRMQVYAALSLERKDSSCSRAPNEHRTLGGFFLRSLQEFEGFAVDGIFGRQRARRNRFFLSIGRTIIVIAGVRFVLGSSTDDF